MRQSRTLVGIGQGAARNAALDAHVVELARLRSQTRFDVAQALAIGQLSKGHAQILVETGKALDLVLSAVARHATTKRRQRQMLRDLREHQLAQVHRVPPASEFLAGSQIERQYFKSRPRKIHELSISNQSISVLRRSTSGRY